jgi:hypothetical protein
MKTKQFFPPRLRQFRKTPQQIDAGDINTFLIDAEKQASDLAPQGQRPCARK